MENQPIARLSFSKPVLKQLLSVAAILVTSSIGIKEASAQIKELPPAQEIKTVELSDITPDNSITECWNMNLKPKFSGGEAAFISYLKAKLPKSINGKFSFSFIIKKDGSPDEITVFGSGNAKAKAELTKLIKDSPRWIPGIEKGTVYYPVIHFQLDI